MASVLSKVHDLPETDPLGENRQFRFFVFFWALYGAYHYALTYWKWLQWSDKTELVLGGTVLALSLTTLVVLRGSGLFAAMLCVWSANIIYHLPETPNHVLLTLLINLTMLACFVQRWIFRDKKTGFAAAAYRDFAPLVRLELIVLYFFVVLHKLNTDYFTPTDEMGSPISCGWTMFVEIAQRYFRLAASSWMQYPAIVGALMFEAMIPLLLIFRRTRLAGVLVGTAFHMMLALHNNLFISSFSVMLFALYALFLAPRFAVTTLDWMTRSRLHDWWRRHRRGVILIAAGCAALLLTAVLIYLQRTGRFSRQEMIQFLHETAPSIVQALFYVCAALYGCILLLFFAWRKRNVEQPAVGSIFRIPASIGVVLLVLTVLNGFSPYVGLKTESCFAMFSNLRTERGETNHFFLPVAWRLADYQEDMVQLVEISSDSSLNRIVKTAQHGECVPYFELRRQIGGGERDLDFFVTYVRNGQMHRVAFKEQPDHEIFRKSHWLERKFLHFRSVPELGQPVTCRH